VDSPPTNGAQNGCHDNSGPLNLQFIAQYFQNEKIYKHQNKQIYSSRSSDPILVIIGQRSRKQGHIMHTAKICHNSVLDYCIQFTLRLSPRTTIYAQTACHANDGCLAKGLKILGFMISFTTYCSIANNLNWCIHSPQGPFDVTRITLTDTPHGALVVNSLTVFNELLTSDTLLKPQILYAYSLSNVV